MKKIIIIVVIVIVLIVGGALAIGFVGFGARSGGRDGNVLMGEKEDVETQTEEVIIKVEENKIYFRGEECVDVEDLIDRISKFSSQNKNMKYVFEYDYAIKSTYDEVKQALINLEDTLGISIDYKE